MFFFFFFLLNSLFMLYYSPGVHESSTIFINIHKGYVIDLAFKFSPIFSLLPSSNAMDNEFIVECSFLWENRVSSEREGRLLLVRLTENST